MPATLIKGDCLEIMKTLPDKSIDCFICDLPYGQIKRLKWTEDDIKKYNRGSYIGGNAGCDWDIKINLEEFWEQVERLAKSDNTPIIHFCNTKFGIDLITSKPDWFRYDLVWNKERGVSFLQANKMPMKSHEMIYIFSKTGAYYKRIDIETDKGGYIKKGGRISKHYGVENFDTIVENGMRCSLSVINIRKVGTFLDLHPTEKPKELYKWLLSRYCPENGTVLDPTAGSFNSIEVASDLGLESIGIEMDETFFYKAVDRFNNKKSWHLKTKR